MKPHVHAHGTPKHFYGISSALARGAESRCQKPPFLGGQARGLLAVGMNKAIKYFLGILILFSLVAVSWSDEVKAPNVAGGFYPSNPKELSLMIDGFLNAASVEELSDIVALVSPHAGYQYSGQVAAYGYKAIKGKKYSTVIVLAPSHYVGFPGISVWGSGKFRTPLGDIPVDSELVARLIKENPQISFIAEAFLKEHSLEVQLPFLQKALTDFKIVPIVMGQLNFKDCQRFADTLTNTVGDRKDILVVASTDLSHFHPANEAQMLDRQTLNYLSQFDAKLLWENSSKYDPSVCGLAPIISTLLYAQAPGDKNIKILKYAHSGDVTGDLSSVVGYVSAAIYKSDNPKGANNMLTTEQRKKLLEIARQSLETFVKTGKRLDFSTNDPVLKKVSGAFVTLKEHNDLRGCIGRIVGDLPLYQVIPQMAIEAGTGDPRFHPVKEADLKDLEYEISVLSPLEKITDINRIQVGTHGIIIRKGFNSGLLLPQVATEYGWDRITFLEQTCRKAGLPADAYKSGAEITIFSAEVFSEKSP